MAENTNLQIRMQKSAICQDLPRSVLYHSKGEAKILKDNNNIGEKENKNNKRTVQIMEGKSINELYKMFEKYN